MAAKHFVEQRKHAETYLIPYFERHCPGFRSYRILDVGCAEAGFLDALHASNIQGMGLELEAQRIATSRNFNPGLEILEGDITDPLIVSRINNTFDLIVIRDVIEHIQDKGTVFQHLRALLRSEGFIYITFPPRSSPFGGHQQNGRSLLKYVPYLHLLPSSFISAAGRIAGEHPDTVGSIILQKHIGLSIRQFEDLAAAHGFQMFLKELFLFRPVFSVRYGLPTKLMPEVPGVREYLTLGCECLLRKLEQPPSSPGTSPRVEFSSATRLTESDQA
ncbi:MAG TPA: class I SAM-dependent methyltransferase [Bacteroidota bacterium]|nr:class I SAM-dependent methyltransferase [Bacteroidota bacterium]